MRSIRFKLWLGMMALIMIVLLLLWLFQIVFLERYYVNMHISDVKKEVYTVIESIAKENLSEYENKLELLSYKFNMSIELIGDEGSMFFSTGAMSSIGQMPTMSGIKNKGYQQVQEGNTVEIPVAHSRFGNSLVMIGLPVVISEANPIAMILTLTLAPVEDTASILKRQLLYITAILLVSSLIIAWMISKSFTRPILNIQKVSESLAAGEFHARIKLKKHDEIGKLADSINYLGEQLSKIEQLRKDLIANISHELRTPLSLIHGYAETIRDISGESREKREKQIGIILEETERLSSIVDDVLNLSQLQSGYAKLEISKFSVKEVVEAVTKRYEVLSKKAQVTLMSHCTGDTVLEADKTRIVQVLYNLINNAFNHTPAGGKIQVKVNIHKMAVRFEVIDTGIGISEEDIDHIWERFYQVDNKNNQKSAGTGLGLAITKSILDAHHAVYGVESKKGVGSTFWFEISVNAKLKTV